MPGARLVEFYRQLPRLQPPDDPDLWAARMHDALRVYRQQLLNFYTEGTLQRLLAHPDMDTRRAAVLGLGLIGTMESNAPLARVLHDPERPVARMASDALWQIWFRGGTDEQNAELQRVLHLPDFHRILAGLDALAHAAPRFAEVFNQRAILFFRTGQFGRSIADCERALELNPFHFGAQAGMGQCFQKLRRPRAALRAFRLAFETNPTLTQLAETIAALERRAEG